MQSNQKLLPQATESTTTPNTVKTADVSELALVSIQQGEAANRFIYYGERFFDEINPASGWVDNKSCHYFNAAVPLGEVRNLLNAIDYCYSGGLLNLWYVDVLICMPKTKMVFKCVDHEDLLLRPLEENNRLCNYFTDKFWQSCPKKHPLYKAHQ